MEKKLKTISCENTIPLIEAANNIGIKKEDIVSITYNNNTYIIWYYG